ncbi:thiol-disulfide oxidoreductase LTO1-like, partial [Lolium perenne]|uniref:thiol-disulfide oxidoreductase LTO1-like n=1 Tax=Lolium perenne TaxID=4522 RepID=UPI003A9903E2
QFPYLMLTGFKAFCPVGGGGCGNVLDNDYSVVFVSGGAPPACRAQPPGEIPAGNLQLGGARGEDALPPPARAGFARRRPPAAAGGRRGGWRRGAGRGVGALGFPPPFLFILNTKFVGTSCVYCLSSAFISFTLFFIRIKDIGLARIQKFVGLQLAVAVIVALSLTNSYSSATTQLKGTDDFVLEPYKIEVTTESTPFAISLAKHLHSIGAKMYGAFWCSHCNDQKQMFGREAMEVLDYVECFPNGAGKGKKMANECAATGLDGFPTWIINGKLLSGDKELSVLAEESGFVSKVPEQS